MRYRLRTLLIVLAIGPPMLAGAAWVAVIAQRFMAWQMKDTLFFDPPSWEELLAPPSWPLHGAQKDTPAEPGAIIVEEGFVDKDGVRYFKRHEFRRGRPERIMIYRRDGEVPPQEDD